MSVLIDKNTKLLVQGITGVIPGGVSTEDFAVVTSTDKNTAEKIHLTKIY